MASKPIREGFQSVVPFLSVQAAASLVEFLCAGLGAKQTFESKCGTHVEVKIGDSMVMIGDVGDQTPATGQLFMYVEDADASYKRAIQAGATVQARILSCFPTAENENEWYVMSTSPAFIVHPE